MKHVLRIALFLAASQLGVAACGIDKTMLRSKDKGHEEAQTGQALVQQVAEVQDLESLRPIDVYVVAGQSNAVGASATPINHADSDQFILMGSRWVSGIRSFDDNPEAIRDGSAFTDEALNDLTTFPRRVGPEIGFARKLYTDVYAQKPVGQRRFVVLKFAAGSSNMADDWMNPAGKYDLKRLFVKWLAEQRQVLRSRNLVARWKGLVWVQGESDSVEAYASSYEQNLTHFLLYVRSKMALPSLAVVQPLIHAQAGFTPAEPGTMRPTVRTVRQAMNAVKAKDELYLPFNIDHIAKRDQFHFNAAGYRDIGSLAAERLGQLERNREASDRVESRYRAAMATLRPLPQGLANVDSETWTGVDGQAVKAAVSRPLVTDRVYQAVRYESGQVHDYVQAQINAARAQFPGDADLKVVFPRQQLRLDAPAAGYHIRISNQKNLLLDFSGSEFSLKNVAPGFRVTASKRVEITNVLVRHDFPAAVLGTVISRGGLPAIEIDEAFRAEAQRVSDMTGNVLGATVHTMTRVDDYPRIEMDAHNSYPHSYGFLKLAGKHLTCRDDDSADTCATYKIPQAVGSRVIVMLRKNDGVAFAIRGGDMSDITLSNVQLRNISGCGISAGEFDRGMLLDNVRMSPESPHFFMGGGCGNHFRNLRSDLIVRNSSFVGLADDGFNVHNSSLDVTSCTKNGTELEVAFQFGEYADVAISSLFAAGDETFLFDRQFRVIGAGRFARATGATSFVLDDVQTTGNFSCAEGVFFANSGQVTRQIYIGDSTFGRSKARGVVLQSSRALIKDNHFFGTSDSAIYLSTTRNKFNEGMGAHDVRIEGNRIENAKFDFADHNTPAERNVAAISVAVFAADPFRLAATPLFRGIRISDNTLEGVGGAAVQVNAAADVQVARNSFQDLHRVTLARPAGSAYLKDATRSILVHNASVWTPAEGPDANQGDASYRGLNRE